MKRLLMILTIPMLLAGCEETVESGHETAKEITGSNMINQGKQVQQQLRDIDRQQQERYRQLDQQ